ncbi:NUDIX domain-containing protein [Paenibacillus sp. SYP-B3998]|uniref:NUDIX domain-containing protein n=1 Tax=Paenibacillus sp. SYP-B3998 TaxID=2678564 RepID=A0A6G3ZWM5_9BACL|nr:NUDIX domain-containing protein [Paenibacillus sp. SYP-B3998]NEW06613.1 NUDIX domain-containing protein [Paenibacillus sp. SYP-B3998]
MNKQEEMFDIYDEQMNWIGIAPRSEVHAKGLWHCTFQCWIVSYEQTEPDLLLQLRSPDKDLFPNLLDISSAGHLAAGETVRDGVRELEEELGLQVDFEELVSCGTFIEEDFISEQLIDREICHVFVHRCDKSLESYILQPEEVSGIFAVKVSALEQLVHGQINVIEANGFQLSNEGQLIVNRKQISLTDLVPHPEAYFELLFRTLREQSWTK